MTMKANELMIGDYDRHSPTTTIGGRPTKRASRSITTSATCCLKASATSMCISSSMCFNSQASTSTT